MATRKMTFTVPEDVAVHLLAAVPSSGRSEFVAKAIQSRLEEDEQQLIAACKAANADPETKEITREFDRLPHPLLEEWNDSEAR